MLVRHPPRALFTLLLAFASAHAQTYLHHQSWTTEDGLPQNTVHSILQGPDGYLWIATEAGLARFDGVTFRTYNRLTDPALPSDDIASLRADPDGTLCISTAEGSVSLVHGHIESTPCTPVTLPSSPWTFTATTVHLAAGPTWRTSQSLPGTRVESLFRDRTGMVWVGTNDGLATLTQASVTATRVPDLSGNTVLATTEDREGNLWIGTEASGLHVLRHLKFRTEAALADKSLTALVQASDGAIWAGTRSDGLRRLQNGHATQPISPDKLTSPIILSLAPGLNGTLWAGTPDGLNHIDARGNIRQITSADGLPDDYIQSLLPDPDGSLWIGTRQGLVHLSHGCPRSEGFTSDTALFRCIETLTTANGLSGNLVGNLFSSREGDLWIATLGGLSRRQPNGAITTQTGLPPGIVTAIAQDHAGALWIATRDSGLTRLTQDTLHHVPVRAAHTLGLAVDGDGNLWLHNEHGIQRFSLAELNQCTDSPQACTSQPADFGLAEGLPTTESATGGSPVLWQMTGGELWFTTRRGVAITDPAHLPINLIAPPVALQQFIVDDTAIDLDRRPLEVSPGHVRYTIEYAALSFIAPSEVRYRFKLEGLDETWTEPNSRRSATYTNLPPRTYIFRVQAMNNDGLWGETGASLRFTVIPPIYRRWWFLTLAIVVCLALAVLLYRFRLRSLQVHFDATLRERNRVAREIHDTLAQDFVGVSLQLDLVSHLLRDQKVEPALTQVAVTRLLVTDGLADARRSIWELRANLTEDSLPARLAKVVDRYSTEPLKIRLKIGGAYRKLPLRAEDEILRIAQESLSNIQRHAQATDASVDLAYGENILTLAVEDNGRGFSLEAADSLTGHYGVSGMKERALLLKATISISTEPGAGARIILTVPAPW